MTPCDDSDYSATWCCGTTKDCCDTDDAVRISRNIYEPAYSSSDSASASAPTSTSTSTSSSSSTSTSTSTPIHRAASSSPASSSSGLSTGGKAGVGVGVGVGGCAIIGLVVFFFLRRRRRNNPANQEGTAYRGPVSASMPHAGHEKPAGLQDSRFELPGEPTAAGGR